MSDYTKPKMISDEMWSMLNEEQKLKMSNEFKNKIINVKEIKREYLEHSVIDAENNEYRLLNIDDYKKMVYKNKELLDYILGETFNSDYNSFRLEDIEIKKGKGNSNMIYKENSEGQKKKHSKNNNEMCECVNYNKKDNVYIRCIWKKQKGLDICSRHKRDYVDKNKEYETIHTHKFKNDNKYEGEKYNHKNLITEINITNEDLKKAHTFLKEKEEEIINESESEEEENEEENNLINLMKSKYEINKELTLYNKEILELNSKKRKSKDIKKRISELEDLIYDKNEEYEKYAEKIELIENNKTYLENLEKKHIINLS